MNLLDLVNSSAVSQRLRLSFCFFFKVLYPVYTTTQWRKKEDSPFKNEWYKNSQ